MTEIEARRMLDEIRTHCPRFVRGTQAYHVTRDGRVNVYRVTPSDRRIYETTVTRESYALPLDVRTRLRDGM